MGDDHLCVLPFIHLNIQATGDMTLCCISSTLLFDEQRQYYSVRTHKLNKYWNSKALQQVRAMMLAGKPILNCRECINAEKKGFGSHRTEKKWAISL